MGNPLNYSLELPERCLQLLDSLWSHASKIRSVEKPDLGPLTSTFLISMSMPIVNVPIERIERRDGGEDKHYANDRPLKPAIVEEILKTLRKQPLGKAPFFVDGAWRWVCCANRPFPNIAKGIPERIAQKLSGKKAAEDAANMPASQWCSILRNALAHGGIAYLDARGRSSHGKPVKMYAFLSGKYDEKSIERPKPLAAVNFLRISEVDYHEFLRLWVSWLREAGKRHPSKSAKERLILQSIK